MAGAGQLKPPLGWDVATVAAGLESAAKLNPNPPDDDFDARSANVGAD